MVTIIPSQSFHQHHTARLPPAWIRLMTGDLPLILHRIIPSPLPQMSPKHCHHLLTQGHPAHLQPCRNKSHLSYLMEWLSRNLHLNYQSSFHHQGQHIQCPESLLSFLMEFTCHLCRRFHSRHHTKSNQNSQSIHRKTLISHHLGTRHHNHMMKLTSFNSQVQLPPILPLMPSKTAGPGEPYHTRDLEYAKISASPHRFRIGLGTEIATNALSHSGDDVIPTWSQRWQDMTHQNIRHLRDTQVGNAGTRAGPISREQVTRAFPHSSRSEVFTSLALEMFGPEYLDLGVARKPRKVGAMTQTNHDSSSCRKSTGCCSART
ncbi:hypothetical protein BD410DRAFT_42709 [Rickenella mellea]|uniref:Uncharacterized protein n=1 Tax=Rickenella mellea TaxID=50990 RepID=A0A4R5XFE9_9AGAM|nr:hypothetical protein BD410DRAFT_42709 [Rickenella mellea]